MTDSLELGVMQRAIAHLNLNDPPSALETLIRGLAEFHQAQAPKLPQSENSIKEKAA
jgi:hypothetical protein